MREQIKDVLRGAESVTKEQVAGSIGAPYCTAKEQRTFNRAFQTARRELWSEQIIFAPVGGCYVRATEAGKVGLEQARRRTKVALDQTIRAGALARSMATATPDVNLRAALERQSDRDDLIAIQIRFAQRQRRF